MPKAKPSQRDTPPARAASVALVPFRDAPRRPVRADHGLTRPDPRFVAHLIAMAEFCPQTRLLRRATPETAQAAYRSADQDHVPGASGIRMRQVA